MELMLVQLIQLTDQIGRDEENKKPGYAVGKRDQQLAQQITIKEAHRFAHRNETFRPMAMRNPRKVARNIFDGRQRMDQTAKDVSEDSVAGRFERAGAGAALVGRGSFDDEIRTANGRAALYSHRRPRNHSGDLRGRARPKLGHGRSRAPEFPASD